MSIVGSPSLPLFPGPALFSHCGCGVIPCEHPERWLESGGGRPTPRPCDRPQPMGADRGEATLGALEGRAAMASWRGEEGRKVGGRGEIEASARGRERDERREIKGK